MGAVYVGPSPKSSQMPLTYSGISHLTVPEIRDIAKGSLLIPRHQCRRKETFIQYVVDPADNRLNDILEDAVKTRVRDQPLKRERSVTESQTR